MIVDIAADVRAGRRSALSVAEATIAVIRARDPSINAVTRLIDDRARADAAAVDAIVAAGGDPGPLAGVPFGVKDLFDVAGQVTTAGSFVRRNAAPAPQDAEVVARLKAAGAVLVATLNMDEFAYGFATVNAHHGTTRNPHDTARLAGGSSGGSAATVAAGMLPLTLGSDTNGSIRIPAALCGVYGLKPSHASLPMAGVFPFVESFDDPGPFATSLDDLRLSWEVMLGRNVPEVDASGLRVARLGGWFARNLVPEMAAAIEALATRLGGIVAVELPDVAIARSAAFLMTAKEGGDFHLPELRRRPLDFDPATRDRLIAGALLPMSAYEEAQRFRAYFRAEAAKMFERYDVLIAPVTVGPAPLIDDPMIEVDGQRVPARAQLGVYTQPLSFIGLPVIAAPLKRPGVLPLGVQLIAAPGREDVLFALARKLDEASVTGVDLPALQG